MKSLTTDLKVKVIPATAITLVYTAVTVKSRTAIKALSLYINLCLSAMLNSFSCPYTYISFLNNTYLIYITIDSKFKLYFKTISTSCLNEKLIFFYKARYQVFQIWYNWSSELMSTWTFKMYCRDTNNN